MSVTIYMTVEVEGEQVKPHVHVTTFHTSAWVSGGGAMVPPAVPMNDVRFGLQVAEQIIEFAERLERESS